APAQAVEAGPIFERIYGIISKQMNTLLPPKDIPKTMRQPKVQQDLSRLIIKQPTEWQGSKPWTCLDQYMHNEAQPDWDATKEQMDKLGWWDEVNSNAKLDLGKTVMNVHPVALVETPGMLDDSNGLKWLIVTHGQLTFDVEGNDIENSIYFSRVPHWPGGVSGITIGRGYDLGQWDKATIERDLTYAGIKDPLYSWLVNAQGLKGNAAKNYLQKADPKIISTPITRKQQYLLFEPVYEFMKNDVITISNKKAVKKEYGTLNWATTDSIIKDIIVDLRYRGDYHPPSRKIIQKAFIKNDIEKINEIINNKSNWTNIPSDRFNRRVDYL